MKILVVDDRLLGARKLRDDILAAEPAYQVEVAAGEGQAADLAKQIVQGARERFDVFLIDDNLGAGLNGCELMAVLREISPNSEAIIFTAYADEEAKRRAIEGGARAYVPRPVNERELLWQLRGIQKDQNTRRERDWLQLLALTTEKLQQAATIDEVGQAVVDGVQRLGFQRARLRRVCGGHGEQLELVGLTQIGNSDLFDDFEVIKRKLTELPYSKAAIVARMPVPFRNRELGVVPWDEYSTPPQDDWFKIPLFVGDEPVGTLSIDNGAQPIRYAAEEKDQLLQLLDQFGKQAAAALERSRLHEQTSQQAEEAKIMSAIGRRITTEAAKGELDDLLDEVRNQVGSLMDVTNFMVVLSDLETGALDFRRQYEETNLDGKPEDRHWRSGDAGLSGYVITRNEEVLCDDTETFRATHGIAPYGPRSQCWLGVPLQVKGRGVGALVVQNYHDKAAYTERHKRLLMLVANQVAGAIHLAYQLERQDELQRQTEALESLKRVMLQLVNESEDVFWHAVLTVVTHRDGVSFNRAALFWYDEDGTLLLGRMGIGYFRRQDARLAWERDRDADHTLRDYFAAPHRALLDPTPLHRAVVGQPWPAGPINGPCNRARMQGRRLICRSNELRGCLPNQMLTPPDLRDGAQTYDCALLPVKSKDGVLGLLVVDNAFDSEPLRPNDLDSLERILAEAMRTWLRATETKQVLRLGERTESVLALQRWITSQIASGQLKTILENLCQEARDLSGADAVVIYPFRSNTGSYELDLVTHVGLLKPEEFQAKTKNKPRQQGVTFSILQSGILTVRDVSRNQQTFGGRRLAEHDYIEREGIKALIGAPMRLGDSGEPVGVIYLDYRSSVRFSKEDIVLAEHIAGIGATAINYVRAIEQERTGRTTAEWDEQQRRRDMQLFSYIQNQALASDSDEEKVIRAILGNAAELFGRSVQVTLALLDWDRSEAQTKQVRQDYHLSSLGRLTTRPKERNQGVIGEVLKQTDNDQVALVQTLKQSGLYQEENVLAQVIRRGQKPVGVILLKKPSKRSAFTEVEMEVVMRLATVAALALDNVRTRAYLQTVSKTMSAVSDKRGLEATLSAVVDLARRVAPDIDCVTLWYEDPEQGGLVPGPQWGVTNDKHKGTNGQTDRLVRAIINRRKPIFASTVEREPLLLGEFTRDEKIASTAAFPLRFGERPRAFGALFLNYHKAHEFTPMERTLFPIFANATATAIHGVQAIELAKRQGKRLETALAVAMQAGATLNKDEVLFGILTILANEFQRSAEDETAPYIMLFDERDRVLELHHTAQEFYKPDRPENQGRVRLLLDERGITCRTARKAMEAGRVVVDNVKNVRIDPDYVEVNSKTESELCAGLVGGGRLLGTLVIKSAQPAAFNENDERLFEMVAQQVCLALERVDAAERLVSAKAMEFADIWRAHIEHKLMNTKHLLIYLARWLSEHLLDLPEAELRVATITNHVRELEEMYAQKLPSQERVNLNCFMTQVTRWIQGRGEWANIHVEYTEFRNDLAARCDPRLLRICLEDLITNAVEAMESQGDLTLIVREQHQLIGLLEIEVRDTGRGIPMDIRPLLGSHTFTTKGAERGNGLRNTKRSMELMGGNLLVPSQPDRGALVVLQVPAG